MRRPDPRSIDSLAAEYVLGTLTGAARRRMVRWIDAYPEVRLAVQAWEDRLLPLARALPPAQPSPEVWTGVRRRIKALSAAPAARPAVPWRRAAAAMLVVGVLAALWIGVLRNPPTQTLADIDGADGRVLWHLAASADRDRLRVEALAAEKRRDDQDFELWALPAGGGNPVSLGLLPLQGEVSRRLSPAQQTALRAAAKLAVSLEPRGGSTTGAPTGPILHVVDARSS
jgi:anti-sigma-K factor RskA